jgi:hypothetical protein
LKSDGGTQSNATTRDATQEHPNLREIAPAAGQRFLLTAMRG